MSFDYYQAPSDEIFNEVKAKAIKLWQTYDDTYGYATQKVRRIEGIVNFKDNCGYIIAMFDLPNQRKLQAMVESEATQKWLDELFDFAYGEH